MINVYSSESQWVASAFILVGVMVSMYEEYENVYVRNEDSRSDKISGVKIQEIKVSVS